MDNSNKENKRVLVWFDNGPYAYINFGICTALKKFEALNFSGIIATQQDLSFFQNQKINSFENILYYPECYLKKNSYDLKLLKEYEQKYTLDIWLDIYSERFFHKHRTHFHKFTKDEILSIVFHSIQFFISSLETIKPDLIIMQTAGENIANFLLYQIAKKIGIKVLMINAIHIHNKVVLSDNLISREISDEFTKILPTFTNSESLYNSKFIQNQSLAETIKIQSSFSFDNSNFSQKMKHYFKRLSNDPEPIYQNVGKTKSKMLKTKYDSHFETKKREQFLHEHSIKQIEDKNFIYFPLHTEPEAKILSTSPFYSNQIGVIENIARSIQIDQILYVKEHPGQKSKLWRSIEDYKKIIELPNVKLVHPTFNSQELISKSVAVISITGSTGFEALFYKKPVILFSDEYYDVLSMVKKVENITQLPNIIKNHLKNFKFNNIELNALMTAINTQSISLPYFSIMKDGLILSSIQRNSENPQKCIEQFQKFYSTYENYFELIAKTICSKI